MIDTLELFVARDAGGTAHQFDSLPVFDGQEWYGDNKVGLDDDLDRTFAELKPGAMVPVTFELRDHGCGPKNPLLYHSMLAGSHSDMWIQFGQVQAG